MPEMIEGESVDSPLLLLLISHLMTMSTHFWPNIFPSGSTTAYFLGLLHSTWQWLVSINSLTTGFYLEGNVELVRIVDSDESLVSCLVLVVEI